MKRGLGFVESSERGECVAALKLCFRKLGPHLQRLFVEAESLFEFATRVRALSAFEQSYRIGRIITESFVRLCRDRRSATQREQQNARRREEEFVPE